MENSSLRVTSPWKFLRGRSLGTGGSLIYGWPEKKIGRKTILGEVPYPQKKTILRSCSICLSPGTVWICLKLIGCEQPWTLMRALRALTWANSEPFWWYENSSSLWAIVGYSVRKSVLDELEESKVFLASDETKCHSMLFVGSLPSGCSGGFLGHVPFMRDMFKCS